MKLNAGALCTVFMLWLLLLLFPMHCPVLSLFSIVSFLFVFFSLCDMESLNVILIGLIYNSLPISSLWQCWTECSNRIFESLNQHVYLDAIASPSNYPCQSVGEWVASPSFASLLKNKTIKQISNAHIQHHKTSHLWD